MPWRTNPITGERESFPSWAVMNERQQAELAAERVRVRAHPLKGRALTGVRAHPRAGTRGVRGHYRIVNRDSGAFVTQPRNGHAWERGPVFFTDFENAEHFVLTDGWVQRAKKRGNRFAVFFTAEPVR